MRLAIKQFMWGFQPHFRNGLERATRDVFEQIGFGLGARAYLVGFTDDESKAYPVCFEPEHDPLAAVDLSDVGRRGQELYEQHPDAQMIITSERHHRGFHDSLRDTTRAEALREALEVDQRGADQYFFIGEPALVEDTYEVHPVIGVPRARWDSKPSLKRTIVDRYTVVPSFQHALMRELLRQATSDLGHRQAPENFSLWWTDRSELIRKAAREFVQSISLLSGYDFPSELEIALDEVAAQPYEGRASAGGIVLAAEQNAHVDVVLEFVEPIPLSETRSLRKALEMTSPSHHLLCDGEKLRGLARVTPDYDPDEESLFCFEIVSRGTWELRHQDVPLLRVSNTRPTLPQPRLDASRFRDTASRIFPECSAEQIDRLWNLTLTASEAEHGTMVVVHRRAGEEASRLTPQSQRVVPAHLTPETLAAVTSIDGAVLVDTDGRCHAVGVILDGRATGTGDASRGARYNSAVRYHQAQSNDSLVIIVSEDGMINLQPNLRRRVRREQVEQVVRLIEDQVVDDPDYEAFFRHWDHLEALSFYLSADQCERVNTARQALEDHRWETMNMKIGWTPMAPHPEMDGSYFSD